MNDGWFKIWRKIFYNSFLRRNHKAFKLFVWCISMADKDTQKFTCGRGQMETGTGIKETTAYYNLKKLKKHGFVDIKPNNLFTEITICNYAKYQKKIDSNVDNNLTTTRQQVDNKLTHYKNKEERIKKTTINSSEYGDKDVNKVIAEFKEVFDSTLPKLQANRYASKRLITRHGVDKVLSMVKSAGAIQGEVYAPSINSVIELEAKLVSLVGFLKRQGGNRGKRI